MALIKPQFEAGRAHVRKGIVKDPAVHRGGLRRHCRPRRRLGWTVDGIIASPVSGGDGNLEFLIGAGVATSRKS